MTPGQNVARQRHLAHIGRLGGAAVAERSRKTAKEGKAHMRSRGSTSSAPPGAAAAGATGGGSSPRFEARDSARARRPPRTSGMGTPVTTENVVKPTRPSMASTARRAMVEPSRRRPRATPRDPRPSSLPEASTGLLDSRPETSCPEHPRPTTAVPSGPPTKPARPWPEQSSVTPAAATTASAAAVQQPARRLAGRAEGLRQRRCCDGRPAASTLASALSSVARP
mmetsp:Transcript_86999/g.245392  ORF Transcript_86999/g.245392 Transcript_86999/m.245392 type:complete len:225 (-) Transcript_86999:62-736(-)